MCRLMLFNTEWLQMVSQIELEGMFTLLDQRNGGHGTGIALCYDKNNPVIYKGVDQEPAIAAQLVYDEKDNPDLRYVVYHTRLASAGDIVDELCHPFSEEKILGLTMAHNGHVRLLAGSKSHSDTAIAFNLITQYGLPLNFLSDLAGVFVGVRNKIPFVIKASSNSELDLCYSPDLTAWCFCSNFYEYGPRLRKRFIVEKDLSMFEWSNRMSFKAIAKMIKVKWEDSYNWNKSQRPLHWTYTSTATSPKQNDIPHASPNTGELNIGGYGTVKTRMTDTSTTYHSQDCIDWINCTGGCLEIKE